ncbi:MAG: DUF6151 family protein [Candidatus Andeanibacterium colombiense]|uniref:DUF6151 family protein n=1 Tax=Candidatus Andeanibacterium colombiense TaxID=3121345 RepID=A0AAJ6BP57_9SPHN|nr:MAG: DUF6151 family protein [Sphingomonadaceae bacterium]
MADRQEISCDCGAVELELEGRPFGVIECLCASCREAGARIESLPGAPPALGEWGASRFVLYRKDRVACRKGAEHVRAHRLTPDSPTRRLVATCCNSAMLLDFTKGHWASLYAPRWPDAGRPKAEMRIQTGSLPDPSVLPGDMPNYRGFGWRFPLRMLGAFAAMGFRSPDLPFGEQPLELPAEGAVR